MDDSQFESDVLETIGAFRGRHEWFSNTLFIYSNEDTARSIFHKLTAKYGLDHVRVSRSGDEYAFDFV